MNIEHHLAHLLPWMTALCALVWTLAIAVNYRRIIRFLTSVEVEHGDWAGARIKHPTFKLTDGARWAVWPVWDHSNCKILRFEKRRLGWRTPRVAATFEEFNEYRRAFGDEREFPASALADESRPRRPDLDDQPSALYESLFDQQYKDLTRDYQDERRRFWARRFPLVVAASLAAGVVLSLALGAVWSLRPQPVLAVAPLVAFFLLWTGGFPRRPTRADAALVVLVKLEQEKERRAGR